MSRENPQGGGINKIKGALDEVVVESNFNFWERISLIYIIFGDVVNVIIIHKLATKKYEMKV
jgi:hypothetical protein